MQLYEHMSGIHSRAHCIFLNTLIMKIMLLIVCLAIGGTKAAHLKRSNGGTPIPITRAPFFVSIRHFGKHICGGGFITTRHVLTAAHCVTNKSYKKCRNVDVMSGRDRKDQRGTLHRIKAVLIAPNFNWLSLRDDIAVIILSAHVNWTITENFVALPTQEPKYYEEATLVAFNYAEGPFETSSLYGFEIRMYPIDYCLGDEHIGYPEYSNMFCGVLRDGQSTSKGDSGGLLVYKRRVVGILSVVFLLYPRCNGFVNVYNFLDLIDDAKGL